MSGIFGVVSDEDCVNDLYYGTDYHSHLGKQIGGLAILNDKRFHREIKDISIYPFRPQFDEFRKNLRGKKGIGVIGDYEPQPLIIGSKFSKKGYAIVHVGKITNLDNLVESAYERDVHFNEMSLGGINPTELVSSLINQGKNYVDGIEIMQNSIEGSSSVLLLTEEGIYAARDKYGRTPINVGKKDGNIAASFESFALENLGFELTNYLGPGEIGILNEEGYNQLKKPENLLQLCTFLLVYYGNPASIYEGAEAEETRGRLGAMLAKYDKKANLKIDYVADIPDSGTGSAIGYANEFGAVRKRPFIKYTETWQRSFMPQNNEIRRFVAKMKLIPRERVIRGAKIEINDDSLVRGVQSEDKFEILYNLGAEEIYFRLSCPPLIVPCKFLNFSISESENDLAARKVIREIEGKEINDLSKYTNENSKDYKEMVSRIKRNLGITDLKYQRLDDLVSCVGLPKENLCTYCWDGCDPTKCSKK